MHFHNAKVADLFRSSQRDFTFTNEMQTSIQKIFKILGISSRHGLQRIIPELTNAWYYTLTSYGNLQTLGEEYTGIIRVNASNRIPSKLTHIFWLSLYIGGEPLYNRLISGLEKKIETSTELTPQSKSLFLKSLRNILDKQTLKTLHQCLFYIEGRHYNISNRFSGISYVLLRQWMEDDAFTKTFKILGYISLMYSLVSIVHKLYYSKEGGSKIEGYDFSIGSQLNSSKICILCAENRRYSSATQCGHVFCWSCIHNSLQYQQTCPVCREVVTFNRIIFLQNYV